MDLAHDRKTSVCALVDPSDNLMTGREFDYWLIYHQYKPLDNDRRAELLGVQMWQLASMKGAKRAKVKDFVLRYELPKKKEPKKQKSGAQIVKALSCLSADNMRTPKTLE